MSEAQGPCRRPETVIVARLRIGAAWKIGWRKRPRRSTPATRRWAGMTPSRISRCARWPAMSASVSPRSKLRQVASTAWAKVRPSSRSRCRSRGVSGNRKARSGTPGPGQALGSSSRTLATRLPWPNSTMIRLGSSYQERSLSRKPSPASSTSKARALWTLSVTTARLVRSMLSRTEPNSEPWPWRRSPPEVDQVIESARPSTRTSCPVASRKAATRRCFSSTSRRRAGRAASS
ncbi:MAG TPA: hypothetical protein VKP69_01290 [Isosphaeraceae bacterium]|nr:hypothetical protein [Isosphaeraceae bacterium]